MTDWLRANLQRKLWHTIALIKMDNNFMKMWRLRTHCLNVPTLSFASEEIEIHNGRNSPHPVNDQNLEFPNPRELHCLLLDTQDSITFK